MFNSFRKICHIQFNFNYPFSTTVKLRKKFLQSITFKKKIKLNLLFAYHAEQANTKTNNECRQFNLANVVP